LQILAQIDLKWYDQDDMKGGSCMEEQWLPMKEVARILNIPNYKLSRVAQKGSIRMMPDPIDGRVKLVEVNEVKRIFRIK
jgi:hypothetical protein